MVKLILWLLGLAILALSIAIILKPQLARDLSERMNETGYAVGAWARIAIGLILLLIADTRSWSTLFNVLGVLLVLAGAYALHIGYERTREFVLKVVHGDENLLRVAGGVGVVLGLLLLSAT